MYTQQTCYLFIFILLISVTESNNLRRTKKRCYLDAYPNACMPCCNSLQWYGWAKCVVCSFKETLIDLLETSWCHRYLTHSLTLEVLACEKTLKCTTFKNMYYLFSLIVHMQRSRQYSLRHILRTLRSTWIKSPGVPATQFNIFIVLIQ